MKPGMQPGFRALGMPLVLCATASLQDFGLKDPFRCPLGQMWAGCGEGDERNRLIESIAVITFPDRVSKAVTTGLWKRPVCAASHHCQAAESSHFAVCVCCFFTGMW